jgi:hypothetical protein
VTSAGGLVAPGLYLPDATGDPYPSMVSGRRAAEAILTAMP